MIKSLVSAFATALVLSSSPVVAENLVLPKRLFPNGAEIALNVVSCINTVNGHVEPVVGTPWELTQAVLELPYEHESKRLADGFFLVGGRSLGFHGTWVALLDISRSDWVAYEVRDEGAKHSTFGTGLVPAEVIFALGECDVKWGGYWASEFPVVVLEAPAVAPLSKEQGLPEDPLRSGADLLPPIVASE